MLEALNLGALYVFFYRLVPHIHRVVYSWNGVGCFAHGERVHLKAQDDKLDDRIALRFVPEVAAFSGM